MSSLICPDLRHSPDLTYKVIANLVNEENLSERTYETATKLVNRLEQMSQFMKKTVIGQTHRETNPNLSERAFNKAIEQANSTLSEAFNRLPKI